MVERQHLADAATHRDPGDVSGADLEGVEQADGVGHEIRARVVRRAGLRVG
jgi:hypothetical protein